MGVLKVLCETPKLVRLGTVVVFAAMVYIGIVDNYIKYMAGELVNASANEYPVIWDNLSSAMLDMIQTDVTYVAGTIVCVFLCFLCLLLGIARSINRLDGKTSYFMAAFLALFTLNTFTIMDAASAFIKPDFLYAIRWITFFAYPFPFFMYVFYNLRPTLYKWTWPLFFLPVIYSITTWSVYLTIGLPIELQSLWHTAFAVSCFIILLTVGFFGGVHKSASWYIRILSILWLVWLVFTGIRTLLLGQQYLIHDEVIINIIISAVISVCYLVFTGTRELFTYKSNTQMLEDKNKLLLDNYQNIESYIKKIGIMKHEMRNHLLAVQMMLDDQEYTQLSKYLADVQDAYLVPDETVFCEHRLIQSMLGHTNQRARQTGIETSIEVTALPPLPVADADLVSLLMNLLNNALESCEKVQLPEKRWLTVAIKYREPYLYISVKNATNHGNKPKDSKFTTTKKDAAFHGYGISIVQNVARKYNGFAAFEYEEESFAAEAALRMTAE